MTECRGCEARDRRILRQRLVIDSQRHELERLQSRVRKLEKVLREGCDYAEVCAHFPGAEVLRRRAAV